MTPNLDFSMQIANMIKSDNCIVNTIFRCFAVKNPDVYLQMYNSLVVPKFLYCAPVWLPSSCRQRGFINAVQRRFLRKLRWRCGSDHESCLIDLTTRMDSMDVSAYRQLERANLISEFFNVLPNNLRSTVTVGPKERAKSAAVEKMFAWRMAKNIHCN